MATKWQKNKVDENSINNGYEYERKDRVTRESLNAIVNNSLYASQISENVANQLSSLNPEEKIEFKGSNPNLLLNGDFSINTKRKTTYRMLDSAYSKTLTVDNWYITGPGGTNKGSLTIEDDGVVLSTKISYCELGQNVYNYKNLKGKTVTASCRVSNKNGSYRLIVYYRDTQLAIANIEAEVTSVTFTIPSDVNDSFRVLVNNGGSTPESNIKIHYIKLEIGSVATAYSPNMVENYLINNLPSNPNLLINGDFSVNQRGQGSYSGASVYCADRWRLTAGSASNPSTFDTLTKKFTAIGQYGSIRQAIEDYASYAGKTVTLSCKVSNITGSDVYLAIADGSQTNQVNISSDGIYSITTTITDSPTRLVCMIYKTGTTGNLVEATIDYIKLEIGSIATAYSPRPYAEELALCQRNYIPMKAYGGSANFFGWGYLKASNEVRVSLPLTNSLRTSPTITIKGLVVNNIKTSGSFTNNLTISLLSLTRNCAFLKITSTETLGSLGDIVQLFGADGTSNLELDAEIY